MDNIHTYKISCTSEQIKKAYSLGAPLMTFGYEDLGDIKDKVLKLNGQVELESTESGGILVAQVPTAEQMIGWLESEMGAELDVYRVFDLVLERTIKEFEWSFWVGGFYDCSNTVFKSRTDATLDAIDHVLDYLISKKN